MFLTVRQLWLSNVKTNLEIAKLRREFKEINRIAANIIIRDFVVTVNV